MTFPGDPTNPLDPSGGSFSGADHRLHPPHYRFSPIGGSAPKAARAGRTPKPRGLTSALRRAIRPPRPPRSTGNIGGHTAQLTSHRKLTYVMRPGERLVNNNYGTTVVVGPPHMYFVMTDIAQTRVNGQVEDVGASGSNARSLGHHPRATGYSALPAMDHQTTLRRALVSSYDAGSATATVRFADSPDAASVALPVVAALGALTAGQTALIATASPDAPADAVIIGAL